MRALVQRVRRGSVTVDGRPVAAIGPGLVVLVGIGREDEPADAEYLAGKVAHLRLFPDEDGRMNRSVLDMGGEVLAVSQFTLYADTRRGRRPSFVDAAPPEQAEPLYEHFVHCLRELGLHVATGRFQTHMVVEIHNDGPVTLMVESPDRPR